MARVQWQQYKWVGNTTGWSGIDMRKLTIICKDCLCIFSMVVFTDFTPKLCNIYWIYLYFTDFFSINQIPWFSLDWTTRAHFSQFSRMSGNPAYLQVQLSPFVMICGWFLPRNHTRPRPHSAIIRPIYIYIWAGCSPETQRRSRSRLSELSTV